MSTLPISIRALKALPYHLPPTPLSRLFSTSTSHLSKPLPPRAVIPEADLEENFLKGSGPGGQKINKTSSAVQLKHLPTGLVVKCQATRSRSQNRKYARQILVEKLDVLANGEGSRKMIKEAGRAKKKASKGKKARRKYRALEEGGKDGDGGGVVVEGDGDEDGDEDGDGDGNEGEGEEEVDGKVDGDEDGGGKNGGT